MIIKTVLTMSSPGELSERTDAGELRVLLRPSPSVPLLNFISLFGEGLLKKIQIWF